MPTNAQLNSNIWKISLIKIIRNAMFIMPIIVLFFQDNGLSMKEIFILQAVFALALLFLEIPSGYFADVIGRKQSIILATFLWFTGTVLYALSYGFWGFLIAEILLAFGSGFSSGADSSLLYDSLIKLKKRDNFQKIWGRIKGYSSFAEATASVIGGFLAAISLRSPFYLYSSIVFFAIPLAFMLYEPPRKKLSRKNPMKKILEITKFALHGNLKIKWLILYAGIISSATLTAFWFYQPYLKFVGIPIALFGIVFAALNLAVGLISIYAYKIEKKLGRKKALISLPFIILVSYFLLAIFNTPWILWVLFLFAFTRVFSTVVITDYLHNLVDSKVRATVLSVKSMANRIPFIILSPMLGLIMDIYTLPVALASSGIVFTILGVAGLFFLKTHKVY
tara:strand:+ start:158 stop:1339 length:1182 start_codon:yes stop_codon:yes gene_type:complete